MGVEAHGTPAGRASDRSRSRRRISVRGLHRPDGTGRKGARRAAVAVAVAGCVAVGLATTTSPAISGVTPSSVGIRPWTDPGVNLGPTTVKSVTFLVTLRSSARPSCLERWSLKSGIHVQWAPSEQWATLTGAPGKVDRSFDVKIDNFRTSTGSVVFAADRAATVPSGLCGEVTGIGTIHSFVKPFALDVAKGGLSRVDLMTAYDVVPLAQQGIDGQGQTVVFLEFSGFLSKDLSEFAAAERLPSYALTFVGKNTGGTDETPMDIETVHEIAPDAHLVVVNLESLATKNETFAALFVNAFTGAAKRWPGALYSVSLGLCEDHNEYFNKTDVLAMQSAVSSIEAKGATVFASSGDAGGLDCTPQSGYGKAPQSSYVGVEEPAALPAVTGTGGTSLSTDANGNYVSESTWSEPLLAQGSGGGVSQVFARPSWQTGTGTGGQVDQGNGREVPDVSADADPATGNFIVEGGAATQGGGTSLAAPIWAGVTALMNQYLLDHGGKRVGFFNPVLYHLADTPQTYPPFHDITTGGNDFYTATPGYDMVTGLGSPDVWNLARDLQSAGA